MHRTHLKNTSVVLLLPAWLGTAAMQGCSTGHAAGRVVITDSAGVSIVTNVDAQWTEDTRWRVARNPSVTVGGSDVNDEYQLFDVVGATRLVDGRIVIANAGSSEMQFYDAVGRHLKTVGRKGSGPGEFQRMYFFLRYGADSLVVWDPGNARWAVFDVDGNYAREIRPTDPSDGAMLFPGMTPFAFGDRSLAGFRTMMQPDLQPGIRRDSVTFHRFLPTGDYAGVLVTIPYLEMNVEVVFHVDHSDPVMRPVRFGRRSHLAAHDTTLWVATGEGYVLDQFGMAGRLLRRVRNGTYEPRPVTKSDANRSMEQELSDYREEVSRMPTMMDGKYVDAQERLIRSTPTPETMPPYARLLVDRVGNAWVEDYRMPWEETPVWTVFDPSGRMLGKVTLPDRFELNEVGDDYVLGKVRDDLDVESVQLFELKKG